MPLLFRPCPAVRTLAPGLSTKAPAANRGWKSVELGPAAADMAGVSHLTRGPVVEMPPRLANVPPFPSVAMKLLSLLSNEDTNFSSIAACIGTDPALAGRLIKRANAADLGSYCEARNVLQAVSALGMERTRELGLALAAFGYAQSAVKTEILRPCWSHTVACALSASEIARHCGLRPAEAYTAGLLHDIGRLGLLAAYPVEYEAIVAEVGGQPEKLIGLERERFGVDHVQAGEWLAAQWNLPESIVEIVARHNEIPVKPLDQVAVVQMAARLADLLGFSVIQSEELPDLDEIAAIMPESARARLRAQLPALRQAIVRELGFSEASEKTAAGRDDGAEDAPEIASSQPAPSTDSSMDWLMAAAIVIMLLGAVAYWLK